MNIGGMEIRDIVAVAGLALNGFAIPIGVKVIKYVKSLVTTKDLAAFKLHVDNTFTTKKEFSEFARDWPLVPPQGLEGNNVNEQTRKPRPKVIRN